MANRKKKDEALAVVQAQTEGSGQPAVQSGYSAAGLESRSEVENALANSSYKPSQTVTDAADALKEWQANRPGDYQSSYQERIDQLLNQLLQRESFQYSYTKDPLYRQYEQNYLQNAHNASADAAAQAAALTGGYGSSYATSAAQQAYQQQIGALSSAIPTLYSLALDTYTSGGNELVSQLDQLNNSEQDAQQQYNNKLSDYYTQLQQKGEAYNNAYAQDNDITWLNWDWMYQTRKTMQMHRLDTVSRLLSIRKSLGLYHHEEFFTRLTQLGLFKPSSRVQWYLPDGTTPMDRDWFDTTIRSFAMRLLSQDEVDVLIVINGVDEVRRFTLPSDCSWQCDWSSATAVGLRSAPGDRLQRIGKNQALRSNWTMSVSEKDNIHQLLKTLLSI